jgi:hypothetical protein
MAFFLFIRFSSDTPAPPKTRSPWSTTSTTLCVKSGPKSGRRATSRQPRSGAARACAHRVAVPPSSDAGGGGGGGDARAAGGGADAADGADVPAAWPMRDAASAASWATRDARKARQSPSGSDADARGGGGLRGGGGERVVGAGGERR